MQAAHRFLIQRTANAATILMFLQSVLVGIASAQPSKLPTNVEFVETTGGISQYRLKSNGMTILLHRIRLPP